MGYHVMYQYMCTLGNVQYTCISSVQSDLGGACFQEVVQLLSLSVLSHLHFPPKRNTVPPAFSPWQSLVNLYRLAFSGHFSPTESYNKYMAMFFFSSKMNPSLEMPTFLPKQICAELWFYYQAGLHVPGSGWDKRVQK